MDNYGGRWGNMEEVYKLKMYYGAEKAEKLARRKGYRTKREEIDGKLQVKIFL